MENMNNKSHRINIAFIVWTLIGMGGSERVIYDIVRKLDKQRFSILIIGFNDGPVRELYEKLGIRVIVLLKKGRYDFGFILRLRKILLAEAITIVNPHHFGPFLYTFLSTRKSGIKLIYTEHSRWQLEQLPFFYKLINRIMLWRADAIVAISQQIQAYYLNILLLNENKVHLIPNGVDIALYQDKKSNNYLRERLGVDKQERIIGMVANIRPEKNHMLLISAFTNVANKYKNVKLLLVGLDCMDGKVQKFTEKSGVSDKIKFLGQRDDVPEVLKLLDIFCLPSINEGLPLTVLEAMAARVPVVGSDVIGINEVVTNNVNGLLFPSGNEHMLTESLLSILHDTSLGKRLSSAGYQFVLQNFSLDDIVKKYDNLFQLVN
jgi:L-malate glycosyltransferase